MKKILLLLSVASLFLFAAEVDAAKKKACRLPTPATSVVALSNGPVVEVVWVNTYVPSKSEGGYIVIYRSELVDAHAGSGGYWPPGTFAWGWYYPLATLPLNQKGFTDAKPITGFAAQYLIRTYNACGDVVNATPVVAE